MVEHRTAVDTTLVSERLGSDLHELSQHVGSTFAREARCGRINGMGNVIGFREEVTLSNSRHDRSVTLTGRVIHPAAPSTAMAPPPSDALLTAATPG